MKNVVIVESKRTPIGTFGGTLSRFTAPELGATAILELIRTAGIQPEAVEEVIFGNVLTAGVGQAPARQAALKGGLSKGTPCTTINKVCASGMKAIMIAADQIRLGEAGVVIAGGMESMSNVPFYLPDVRFGSKLGHGTTVDGILKDGLWDVYKDFHMGNAAELCAEKYGINREEQDRYAKLSYRRALEATDNGYFSEELIPIKVKNKGGTVTLVERDEEPQRVQFDKFEQLKPVFSKGGTVTAANASSINDGAAALLLLSEERANELNLTPVARIRSYASSAKAPEWYTTAPSDVIPIALKKAELTLADIDLFEINEAFSVVSVVNNRLLDLDEEIVNIHGGAVSLGHPIGCSGARIVVTLLHALKRTNGTFGCAAICNGGGGASALVVERID